MSEFTNIYVDLERTTLASGIINPLGFVECNSVSKGGTVTNPLNLNQFREYLYFDHDNTSQNFFLKGQTTLDMSESSDIGKLGSTVLFETPHSKLNIKISNWGDNVDGINYPWSIVVSGTINYTNCDIITNNDDVEISNGEIETAGNCNFLVFGVGGRPEYDDLDYENNTLTIVNTKLYTNSEEDIEQNNHQLVFYNYRNIYVINSLISNKTGSGSLFIENTFTGIANCYFTNNIFYKFKYMLGSPQSLNIDGKGIIAHVNQSVFSEGVNGFSTSAIPPTYYNIFDLDDIIEVDNVQFNWAGSSACTESLLDLSQSANFNYLDVDWVDITVSGIQDTNNFENAIKKNYSDLEYTFSNVRDGIGALTFNMMGPAYLSASIDGLSATIMNVSGGTYYDDIFSPLVYNWELGEYDSDEKQITSAFNVIHTYQNPGQYDIYVEVISHNGWYNINNYTNIQLLFTSAAFTLFLLKSSATCFDDNYSVYTSGEHGNLSAYTFDEITLSAVNTSTSTYSDIKVFKSWGHDFGNYNTYVSQQYYNKKNRGFEYANDTYIKQHRYISSGHYYVNFGVQSEDGSVSGTYKEIDVYNKPYDTYYVDLDEYYETSGKWMYKQTGMFDEFENSVIDSGWSSSFLGGYNVVDMWGYNCATGGVANLISSYLYYNFDFEWEFSRTERTFVPHILIKSNTTDVLKFEWDFLNDRINVEYYGTVYHIKYTEFLKCGKDLRCPESLRFLPIRVKFSPESEGGGNIQIYVKFDGVWKEYTHILPAQSTVSADDKRLIIEASTDTTTGFNYIKLQSQCGLPYSNGSSDYPLTYKEFKRMTTIEDNGVFGDGMSTADYNSKFLLKNYRKIINSYKILINKYYQIDAWDNSVYGPWMIICDMHFDNISVVSNNVVSFISSTISNGIIYNIREENSDGKFVPNLEISTINDMFIVWSTPITNVSSRHYGYISLYPVKMSNRDITNYYSDVMGSTVKSERGYIIYKEEG